MEETIVSATPTALSKKDKISHRIWEIDFLRGLAILLMVFDHLMYDFTLLPGLFLHNYALHVSEIAPALNELGLWWFYISPLRYVGHIVFVTLFALIVGISCSFSRSNVKRGTLLLLFALFISGITLLADYIFDMGLFVVFGILHTFAISIFIYSLLRLLPWHRIVMLVVGVAILIVFFIFGTGIIPQIDFLAHPSVLNYLKIALGLASGGSDWDPLLPWVGVVLIGGVIGETFYKKKTSLLPKLDGKWNKPVSYVGRHTIWIYLVHQPILVGLMYLILYFIGYRA